MRAYSTAKSAHAGEITKLAIVETLLSVALYISICIVQGSWRYLAAAVAVAPFMLFRTERSADWALAYWRRWIALLDPLLEWGGTSLTGFAVLTIY